MTEQKRVKRLNSLLREVISEVVRNNVKDPRVSSLITVTEVEITKDLHQAKVFVSIIGNGKERLETLEALNSASGFIGVTASKKVVMRYFPTLTFKLDTSVDEHIKIDSLIDSINREKQSRPHASPDF